MGSPRSSDGCRVWSCTRSKFLATSSSCSDSCQGAEKGQGQPRRAFQPGIRQGEASRQGGKEWGHNKVRGTLKATGRSQLLSSKEGAPIAPPTVALCTGGLAGHPSPLQHSHWRVVSLAYLAVLWEGLPQHSRGMLGLLSEAAVLLLGCLQPLPERRCLLWTLLGQPPGDAVQLSHQGLVLNNGLPQTLRRTEAGAGVGHTGALDPIRRPPPLPSPPAPPVAPRRRRSGW